MKRASCPKDTLVQAGLRLVTFLAGGAMTLTAAGPISAAEAAGRSVYWQEGESFTAAPQCVGSAISDKPPASGGRALAGNASKVKGSTVTYEIDLPQSIADAQIIFRFARLHWKTTMVPARFTVEITGANNTTATGDIVFPDTKGWGLKSSDWRLAAAKLGELKPGHATVKLTGQHDENDVVIDGFYIAPADFAITADELALTRIVLTAQGYLGLKSATTIRQDLDKSLVVVTRGFGITPEIKSISIGKTIDSATAIRTASTGLAPDVAQALTCELPDLDDGNYVFVVEDAAPSAKLTVPVILAGQFLAALDQKVAALESFTADLAASQKPGDSERLAEFQHAIDYLKSNAKQLSADAASAGNALKQGLAAKEGVTKPAPVVDGLRRTLLQYEETMSRLKDGKDPYAGRTGDFRLAFRSAVSGELQVFRAWIPSNYGQAAKVPLVLMLHGGGGDENSFPDLDDGKVLKLVNDRGYLVVFPKWQRQRNQGSMADLHQLLELIAARYPKIDLARRYCTGLSMGGFGTFAMAANNPDLFAAVCCVSGTGSPALAEKIRNVPLLILQGGNDEVVLPQGATRLAARLKELGAPVDLHVFPTHGHDYFTDEYLKLTLDFFDQHKKK